MEIPKNVGFATKYLSNRNYLKELSVDGKRTGRFYFYIGFYDKYVSQIIRNGNCISLLTHEIGITSDNFWNTNYFEDLSRFVFWTFNKSFLLTITEKIDLLKLSVLKRCRELLSENPAPYGEQLQNDADEELQWCILKSHNLKKSGQFENMYALDEQNRSAILSALDNKIASLSTILSPVSEISPSAVQEIKDNNTPIFFRDASANECGSLQQILYSGRRLQEAAMSIDYEKCRLHIIETIDAIVAYIRLKKFDETEFEPHLCEIGKMEIDSFTRFYKENY